MAGQTLTPKQEAFAQAYVETGNASEAYRRAYSPTNSNQASINREAKTLLDHPKIAPRIEVLRQSLVERHNLTVDDIAKMLTEDRKFARELEKPAAAVSASMGLAKLYGHLTDKVELGINASLANVIRERRAKVAKLDGQ